MITIVDALMGTGKTSWAIQYIETNTRHPYMFVTPYLTEIDRVRSSLKGRIKSPIGNENKSLELSRLLAAGENIACTHQLFKMMSESMLELVQEKAYVLILDEVLDAVTVYNKMRKDDIKMLQEANILTINDDGLLNWNPEKRDYQTRFNDLKFYIENKQVFCTDNSNVMVIFDPQIFKAFSEIFVLTYMFEGSVMYPYFQLFQIPFKVDMLTFENGVYVLGKQSKRDVSSYRELISIYNGGVLDKKLYQKETAFSIGWLHRLTDRNAKIIRNDVYNYFQNIVLAKGQTKLYTTSKEAETKLAGRGYKKAFLPWNARATNEYSDRYNLAYCFNCYVNPAIINFFGAYEKNIVVYQELYALSNMLQWIWRSRIRHGKFINVFIPSFRMRNLLSGWLEGSYY